VLRRTARSLPRSFAAVRAATIGLIICVATGLSAAPVQAQEPLVLPDLRVMTWNAGTTRDQLSNPLHNKIKQWSQVIGNQKPDIVGLQEICMVELDRLLYYLEEDYHMEYIAVQGGVRRPLGPEGPGGVRLPYPSCAPLNDRDYGQAMLSLHPVTSTTTVYAAEGAEPRGYMHAEVAVSGYPVHVFNTHIDHDAKEAQIDELRAAAGSTEPAIVLGDFNVKPGEAELGAFEADPGFIEVDDCDQVTFPNHDDCDQVTFPNHDDYDPATDAFGKIDHMFLRGLFPITGAEVYTTGGSDHRPLVANLRFVQRTIPRF
jgi:endonuclease/exonuclease/phosphatase family metal-dependent hydrolase